MDIRLEDNEFEVLRRALTMFLSDLRMEISNTEKYELRESLKADEAAIKAILTKLGGVPEHLVA
ncbi:MAG: hypothetical protein HY689_06990 [Chloroflexi bacterium]|nr:hypothetical protein [Chloroflexota bacterium]